MSLRRIRSREAHARSIAFLNQADTGRRRERIELEELPARVLAIPLWELIERDTRTLNNPEVTLDELAQELGVTRQRVLQIEQGALVKLRKAARRPQFAELVEFWRAS